MQANKLLIDVLPDRFGICRLDPHASVPSWALTSPFYSVTRTPEEVSVVCHEGLIPDGILNEKGWRCLKVHGPIDFSATGILSSLAQPLARADVPIFVLSTYDTDYLFVREEDLSKTIEVLSAEGILLR
ncbi:MAG: ACT domain-containing protein [Desulfobacterales bacterium]|nr:MAG: ACT domain-containing protein [Desulfobacterales bacterium]UCD89707.1 MAG: ACT domain-containing protein [Desulfobacterales bacterium]